MANSADPDQLASSAVFAKAGHSSAGLFIKLHRNAQCDELLYETEVFMLLGYLP